MRVLKALFNFYLDASIHVAFAVVSLYLTTLLWLNKTVNPYLLGFIIFSTVVCYNFMKYGVEAEKYFIVQRTYHKIIQVFSFLCFPIAVYCFLMLDKNLWFPIALLTLISGLYILPFMPHSKNLRTWGGFKIYLVALVWVGFTVVLPVLEHQIPVNREIVTLMLRRFVLVLILFIPFEIRDLQVDEPEMKTLPQRLGVAHTKFFGYVLITIYLLLFLWGNLTKVNRALLPVLFVVLWLSVKYSKEKQPKYFASFWVEAIPIFMLGASYFVLKLF